MGEEALKKQCHVGNISLVLPGATTTEEKGGGVKEEKWLKTKHYKKNFLDINLITKQIRRRPPGQKIIFTPLGEYLL